MVDFINEVEEELRKDQYNVLLRKWGPLIAAVAIGIVAVAGVYEYIKTSDARAAKNASISYVAASNTLESGDTAEALRQFKAIAGKAKPGYAGLALSQAAGIELENGRLDAAAALFDQASNAFETELHKQLAQYKAALILSGQGRHDDVLQRVEPLIAPGNPFSDLARELRGFTHFSSDDLKSARSDFLFLSTSPGTSEGIRMRAEQMLALTPALSASLESVDINDDATDADLKLEAVKAPTPIEADNASATPEQDTE